MTSEPAYDLAVILVSTNEKRWLGPCLSSLYARAGTASLEVIVVDNESTDGTREFVETTFPSARDHIPQRRLCSREQPGVGVRQCAIRTVPQP